MPASDTDENPSDTHLLARSPGSPDPGIIGPFITGRTVLITGAGGSIGSIVSRTLAAFGPARLVLLDHAEHALWRVGQDMQAAHPDVPSCIVLADVRDRGRVRTVFATFAPDFVIHAAALKHVPMVEANPLEGLLTNAVGTRHVLDAGRASRVRGTLLLSTDKAVLPRSVMGVSKALAEMYALASDHTGRPIGNRALTLRFGNVLDSSGSVLPIWRAQAVRGAPLELTHPEMTRYFITRSEAAGLICATLAHGLNDAIPFGSVAIMDIAPPVRLADLLARFRAAHAPGGPIRISAPRPGEKLSEALNSPDETLLPTRLPGLRLLAPREASVPILARAFDELEALCHAGKTRLALSLVSRLIPGFTPSTDGRESRLSA